jgi:hypothetical protein
MLNLVALDGLCYSFICQKVRQLKMPLTKVCALTFVVHHTELVSAVRFAENKRQH